MDGCAVLAALLLGVVATSVDGQLDLSVEYREPHRTEATYMIVAPRRFRPNQVYRLYVTILKQEYHSLHFHAIIRNVDLRSEIGGVSGTFNRVGGRELEIKVPEFVIPGNYSLYVEAKHVDGVGGAIYHNETALIFDTKQMSIFIETDKVIYNRGNSVRFRVIPVLPNLMPVQGTMDIFVKESNGVVVRRWLAQAVNNGIIEKSFDLPQYVVYGRFEWIIEIQAFGHVYTKKIRIEEIFPERMIVNVTLPPFIKTSDYGLAGFVKAYYFPSWLPMKGNGTVELSVEGFKGSSYKFNIPYFEDEYQFIFTMNELRRITGVPDLSNKAIKVTAWVYDRDTYEYMWGEAKTVIYDGGVEMYFVEDIVRTFKPNMPFNFHVAVKKRDGTPPSWFGNANVELEIIYQEESGRSRRDLERVAVPDDNIIAYTITPGINDQFISIQARYRGQGMNLPRKRMTAYRVYSTNKYYIQVTTSTLAPKVNRYIIFTVRTNTYVDTIYYHIVCGGNMVMSDELPMTSMLKTFSVALSRDMMPSARMVVYFVKRGEVVADALSFYVDGSSLHEVDVELNWGKDFGPAFVEVIGTTDPGTLIAFNAINYYLYSLGARNFITEQDIIDELLTYDSHANVSASVSWIGDDWNRKTMYFPTQTYGSDANTTFVFSGLHVFTDANLTTVPSDCNATSGWMTCYDGSCYRVEKKCDKQLDCNDGADESGCGLDKGTELTIQYDFYKDFNRHQPYVEPYEPVSWMWHTDYTKPSGESYSWASPTFTPFFYALSALSVSRDNGLGVVQQPYRVDMTRGLYAICEYPKAARKGEQIGIQLWLSSFVDTVMEVLVTLPASDQYRFVAVGDELKSYIDHYSPKLIDEEIQTLVYLEPGEKRFIHMPILPTSVGITEFEIIANTFDNSEGCSGSIEITMDGVQNEWHTPYFVDLVKFSQVIIPDLWIPIPERFILPEQRHHLYVPGSTSTTVSVVGDVVGPAFYTDDLSVGEILGLPAGTVESYFFEFSQNLWYLKFLQDTDQLTYDVAVAALLRMSTSFEQIHRFRHPSGGFSLFWDSEPSLWVTSLLFNQLKFARDSEWEEVFFVDPEFMNDVALWIVSRQNTSVGCWKEIGTTYMRQFIPKLQTLNGKEDYWNITLTAYVVIALSGNVALSGEASSAVEKAKNLGADFLATTLDLMDNSFDIAIVTYALHAAEHRIKKEFFNKLKKMSREDKQDEWPYWSSKEVDPMKVETIDVTPFLFPNEQFDADVDTNLGTAYALMSYVKENYITDASKIMYWIQSRRQTNGGWSGTVDSIANLQALYMYGVRNPNRDLYHLELTIESTATPEWSKVITLTKNNFNIEQQVEIPNVWGSVKVTARGNGLAMLQVRTSANQEFVEQLRDPDDPPPGIERHFDLTINLQWGGANFSIMYIQPCARWHRIDKGPHSMLAFFQIDLPTGYVVIEKELVKQRQRDKFIRRNMFSGNTLEIFVDKIGTDWLCTKVRADRWYPVANASIQHQALVAEYYEPELQNWTLYTTYNLFSQHICLVCGSFQCPYCPYYNSGDVIQKPITKFILILVSPWTIYIFSQIITSKIEQFLNT
ncbi:unnamed protein product [Owenia fusiformis]|uniref:CD109 antigen n=1 Tax=Owenia fusiformis TaxID=6347 RepID=A0A8S4NM59_OWEFU|nr:unnamed protein product [Owenia fusiformis]